MFKQLYKYWPPNAKKSQNHYAKYKSQTEKIAVRFHLHTSLEKAKKGKKQPK